MAVTQHLGSSSISSRIETIRRRHQEADYKVRSEQKRPRPNPLILKEHKRQRLRLKDELAHYEGRLKTLLAGAAMA